jgi:hypothetical protein
LEAARAKVREFDESDDKREKEDRLKRKKSKTLDKQLKLTKLKFDRGKLAKERDSWRAKRTDEKKKLETYKAKQKSSQTAFTMRLSSLGETKI